MDAPEIFMVTVEKQAPSLGCRGLCTRPAKDKRTIGRHLTRARAELQARLRRDNLTTDCRNGRRDVQQCCADEYFFHRRRGRCMNHGVERRQCQIAVLVVSVETAPMTEDLT